MRKEGTKNMSILEIHAIFKLLQQMSPKDPVYIPQLARELKVKATDLMLYINQKPKLFKTHNGVKTGKLIVDNVYSRFDENPVTDEWLTVNIESHAKYLFIQEYDNYGHVSGYYICIDEKRTGQWRNTPDKIAEIQRRFELPEAAYWIGGLGDSALVKPNGFEINLEQLSILKSEGWTFNEYKSLTK